MLEILQFLGSYILYAIAFFAGSVLAAIVAKRTYPAQTERQALDELDGLFPTKGASR